MRRWIFPCCERGWDKLRLSISEYEAENLKLDAKTLVDISRVLEMDGRFKVVPSILDSIANDIADLFKGDTSVSMRTLKEVINRARV